MNFLNIALSLIMATLTPTQSEDHFALLIGLQHYGPNSLGLGPLPAAHNDVIHMRETLEKIGYIPRNIKDFTDRPGTPTVQVRDQILFKLQKIVDIAAGRSQDTNVLVFFSGHGLGLGSGPIKYRYVVPSDGSPLLSTNDIALELQKEQLRHRIVFIDACAEMGKQYEFELEGRFAVPPPLGQANNVTQFFATGFGGRTKAPRTVAPHGLVSPYTEALAAVLNATYGETAKNPNATVGYINNEIKTFLRDHDYAETPAISFSAGLHLNDPFL